MKFNIGDIVQVRPDLQNGVSYGHMSANRDMAERRGTFVTISAIRRTDYWGTVMGYHYAIREDYGDWCWTDEMFVDTGGDGGLPVASDADFESFLTGGVCSAVYN